MIKKASLYLMAGFYIVAGLNHFRDPTAYLWIMPPYLAYPEFLNYASGAIEILLGILLFFQNTRRLAAYGVIALLIAISPAHFYMLKAHDTVFKEIPLWLLWARIPLQLVLIGWAFVYTRYDVSLNKV